MPTESAATFCFYNYNERMEVLNALNYWNSHLRDEQLEPNNVRPEVLNRLIDDFQEFTLAN